MSPYEPLLEVRHLTTEFALTQGVVHAVQDVSFEIGPGEVLGIVGESGCGKSVTALSLMRLITAPGRIAAGEVLLRVNGQTLDMLQLTTSELGKVRGNQISIIFQTLQIHFRNTGRWIRINIKSERTGNKFISFTARYQNLNTGRLFQTTEL